MTEKAETTGFDLASMDRQQLEELKAATEKRIAEYDEAEKQEALEEILQLAADHGITQAEIQDAFKKRKTKKTKTPRKPKPPKYRNPNNPEKTWTGNGRTPSWMPEDKTRWSEYEIQK